MNKQNKVLLGALAFVVACTIGYALFSESINITGTATAKGDFSITPTCSVITENFTTSSGGDITVPNSNAYKDAVCSVSGNKVTTSATLLYPTASVIFKVTFTNTGSIPAVVKSVDSPNNVDLGGTSGNNAYFDSKSLIISYFGLEDADRGETFLGNDVIGSKLEPGESKDMIIFYSWGEPENFTNLGISVPSEQPEVPAEGVTTTYDVTLGFEQITAD